MLLRQLRARIEALEALSPDPCKPRKALLPAWLTDDLRRQGVEFDAEGRPQLRRPGDFP